MGSVENNLTKKFHLLQTLREDVAFNFFVAQLIFFMS